MTLEIDFQRALSSLVSDRRGEGVTRIANGFFRSITPSSRSASLPTPVKSRRLKLRLGSGF
ncbi:MAG TPA: hypothetical protein VEH04_03745 [Verrucomicrobiae bacterium]|nr:hypothetical protein [Verrucomicrobiae bacterium]